MRVCARLTGLFCNAPRRNTGSDSGSGELISNSSSLRSDLSGQIHFFLETWFHSEPSPDREVGIVACFDFTPERYERCPVLFSRLRFARTFFRCSRPPICSRPRRTASPRVRRSTRPSITPPTISPQLRSMRAPADINNLLDGIGNGVQVLQAANTGITSLQKLVDSAKSVANQALQTTVGFSTKSSFTSVVIDGATADNLVADQASTSAAFVGAASPQRAAYTSTTLTAGTQLFSGTATNATGCNAAVGPDHHRQRCPGDRCRRHADCQRQDDHLRSGFEWPRRFGQRLYAGYRQHA